MDEIIIYVDESNTEGFKFESSGKIVGASYYIHNEEQIKKIKKILNGKEIKGSFLMRRDMNDVLFTLLEISLKNAEFGIFNFSSDLNYFKDRSFDIFYPWSFKDEFDENVEEVRQKLISIVPGRKMKLLNEEFNKTIESFKEYRKEILSWMSVEKRIINQEDIKVIKNHFDKKIRINSENVSNSRHTDIIEDVITIALKYIKKYKKNSKIKIIIDDFSNKKIKDKIAFDISVLAKILIFKK